jgi:uncharacterized OB-fold protein
LETVELEGRYRGPGPIQHPESAPFWASVADGHFCLQVCDRCRTVRFPVSPVCFSCLSFEWSLLPINGRGRVASAVVVHVATGNQEWATAVPYISALVDMDVGVRLPGRVICRCGQALEKGTPVEAVRLFSNGELSVFAFAHDCARPGPGT